MVEYNPFGIASKLRSLKYSVIPSGSGEKHKAPAVNWTDYQKRLPTEKEIQEWQESLNPPLWGIVTGGISRLVVLDADTTESREALQAELGTEAHIITPRGGGHWYFGHPGHRVRTTVAVIPDVDVRGDGGFVNIIGTRPDGSYQVVNFPERENLLPWGKMPERIRQQLNGSKPAVRNRVEGDLMIAEGQRNAKLASIAGSMRRQGMTQDIIEASLLRVNASQCKPPLSEREVIAIAGSISRYEPGPGGGITDNYKTLTDVGNAERLAELYGDRLRFSYERNLWLIYTGKRWEWDPGGKIIEMAKKTARSIYHEAAEEPDDKNRGGLAKHAKASESNQRIKGMVELARASLQIKIEDLNADQWLLNVNNGTIDLRNGKLRPHNPGDYITYSIPTDYESSAESPLWQQFLDRIFESNADLIRYIQESLGYSITGSQDEQALWFNYGSGWNGKTTLMGVIIDILGDYAIEVDPLAFVADKNAKAGPNEALASLYNRRFVASTEVRTGMMLDVALIKRMTGGEMLRCERKFEHGFMFKPTHKLWLSGNHEPRITDTTNSIWNRLKYIPFKVVIPEKERIKGLRNIISRDHAGAVLRWLVDGCLLWQSEGLGEPPEVREAIQAYRESQDILHDFLTESCLFQPSETMPVAGLYKEYKKWADENDINPAGKITFGNLLKEKNLTTRAGNRNQQLWQGIRLLTEDEKIKSVNSVNAFSKSSQDKISRKKRIEKSANTINTINTDGEPLPPPYPIEKCRCGCEDFWLREAGPWGPAAWLCKRCHPQLGGDKKQ